MQDPATGICVPLPPGLILSSDFLRQTLFGQAAVSVDGHPGMEPRSLNDTLVFDTLLGALESRMAQRLTTFIDAMSLTEADRNAYARIACNHGMAVEVLLFDLDLDTALARNASRAVRVPEASLRSAHQQLIRTSDLPYRVIPADQLGSAVLVDRRSIPVDQGLDVIGDVHGLLEPLKRLLGRLGYDTSSERIPHPDGRKLLFLGDMVDRGPHSVEVLELVRRAVQKGGHLAIRGNHEQKLLQFLQLAEQGELKKWSSMASATTGMAFLAQPTERQTELKDFLRSLPGYYVRGRIAFVHADIPCEFQPANMAVSDCIYGLKSWKSDEDTDALTRMANPKYWIVRGHIPQTSEGAGVVAVYRKAEYGGSLVALPLPSRAIESAKDLSAIEFVEEAGGYNYGDIQANRSPLKRDLDRLVSAGLVMSTMDTHYGLTLYKYAPKVFYENLWARHPALTRARGIVFDLAGQIVQNPFTKVFNFNENGTTLADSEQVIAVEKLNGFLASISLHPVRANEFLITTSGSFTSSFVRFIHEALRSTKAYGPMLRYLRSAPRMTLLFEVLHPEDPHVVRYSPDQLGLYLIGARTMGEQDLETSEETLDRIAEAIGFVKRPNWTRASFGQAREWARNTSNVEGWMIRADNAEQRVLLKLKGSWYLATKFCSRLSTGKVAHMYANPENFKRDVDEEFYYLVDRLTAEVPKTQFLAMEEQARMDLIATILE